MHQRRRPRRREEQPPPVAAEFGRRPSQGNLLSGKQSNASRVTTDSTTYINGFSAEEDCISLDIRKSSPKTADEISIKELIEEEVSKVKESRHSSPGLIARLMGLDAFPSLAKQKKSQEKNVDSCSQITTSTDLSRKYAQTEDRPLWSNNEKEDFKDVFEVTEASKSKKRNNPSEMREMLRFREHENDMSSARQNFMDMKYFSYGDVLQDPKDVNGAFRVKSSAKDLFLELLEDHDSLFAKHLHDLKQEPYSPQRSKITILKPCKGTRNSSNKVQLQRSPKAERNRDKCSRVQQKATGSFRALARRFSESFVEENTGSLLQSSLASSPYGCIHETSVQSSHIVILKPSLTKTQKMAETNLFSNDKLWFGSRKGRLASKIQGSHKEGRNKLDMPHFTEVLKHDVNDSKEIAREIRRKMRHNLRSLKKRNFITVMDCNGNGDSFTMPGIAQKLVHPDAISQFPDSCYEWSNSFSPLSSDSTESLLRSEAQRLSFARENIIHKSENVGVISGGSSPLERTPGPSKRETPTSSVDLLNLKKPSGENLASNEVLSSKGSHLGIYMMDALRDGSSRFSLRSNSPPASSSPELGDRKGDGWCYMLKDIPDIGPSVSSGAKLSMAMPLFKSSEHHNHRSQLADLVEEDNMLPEREIHVNSEGLRKKIHTRGFSANNKLQPAPTHPDITDGNQLTSSPLISVFQNEVGHFATHEEQESFNDGIQVKLLQSESDMSKSQSVSSKDLEHSSPVSVLETPEDEAHGSGCFERLSADLKELRIQLERLKQESAVTHLEENEILKLNDAGYAGKNCMLLPSAELRQGFIDDEDREFVYLLDVLLESGIHSSNDSKLVNACYLLGCCPLDQNVFSKLEKRYDAIASWSRSERKLLFDLINCSLEYLVRSYMDVHSRTTSNDSFTEDLWQMVMKQRKELQCKENKILEPEWSVGGRDNTDDSIQMEIEKMLSADLLEELFSDYISA